VNQRKTSGNLDAALAILISNTRTQRRPLSLLAVADALSTAIDHLGGYSNVADRIGLSAKMLRQFSYVRRLAPAAQRLFRQRRLDSVDAAVHLSMLPKKEQPVLASAIAKGEIDGVDLRAITELRRHDSKADLSGLIKKVKESKTKKEYVAEFLVRGRRTERQIRAAVERYIPRQEIIRIETEGPLGRLVLTKKGKIYLGRAAKAMNKRLNDVLAQILKQ